MHKEPNPHDLRLLKQQLRRRKIRERLGSVIGFKGKTFWDFLQLLIVPLLLSFLALWLNEQASLREEERNIAQRQAEQLIAEERSREEALQSYLDRFEGLLLDYDLRTSDPDDEVRSVAQARTSTVLRGLDGRRKGELVQFLYSSGLIHKYNAVISLSGADLSEADLSDANLSDASLYEANLARADLFGVFLTGTDLTGADLRDADLRTADLFGANLIGANLRRASMARANLRRADLREASLTGANLIGANLSEAQLSGAELLGADLGEADLSGAILSEAYMREADLSGANLGGTNLGGAWLEGADLFGANLSGANLGGACLAEARISEEQLDSARSIEGAVMPDESFDKCLKLRD